MLRNEIIELEYNPEDETGKKQTKVTKHLRLRKVCYLDEQNRYYEFLTNSFEITAGKVAFLYKCHQNPGLVYANCSVVVDGNPGDSQDQKGVFRGSCTCEDALFLGYTEEKSPT